VQQVKIFLTKSGDESRLEKDINDWLKEEILKGTVKEVLSVSLSNDSYYLYAIITFSCSPDYTDSCSIF